MDITSTVGLSLFEEQLIRNYLGGDEGKFLRHLSSYSQVIIFTRPTLVAQILSLLANLQLQDVSVISFNPPKKNLFIRGLESLMRWSTSSRTISLKIRRSDSKRQFLLRRTLLFLNTSSNHALIKAYRKLYLNCFSLFSIKRALEGDVPNLDSLFLTSLSNSSFDVPLAVLYRKSGTTILGTVRSWDNLTSHGSILLVPDRFLSHSEWLTEAAVKIQKISGPTITPWGSPSHLGIYKSSTSQPVKKHSFKSVRNILFASMGLRMNPDEELFLKWLAETWANLPKHLTLNILEHPKFTHNSLIDESERIHLKRFGYSSSSLGDYYDFLKGQDLVLGGGTTVLLDAAFAQVPVIAIQFEVGHHDYWNSALRQFDAIEHTLSFFQQSTIKIAQSKEELISLLEASDYSSYKVDGHQFFSGYDVRDIPDIFRNN